jgi:membrane-associated phospholipid phosphatase
LDRTRIAQEDDKFKPHDYPREISLRGDAFIGVVNHFRAALFVVFSLSCTAPTRAQSPYALDPVREGVIVGGGVAGSLGALAIQHGIVPLTPDEVAGLSRADVNAFDRGATYRYSTTADGVSDWAVYGLLVSPCALLMSAPVRADFWTYGTMYGETLLLTLATVQLTKGLVLRTRPYAYNADAPMDEKTTVEARTSFYSSHTAFAFASAVFMSLTFQAYEPDSPLRPWIWAASLSVATATGVLRYTAGSHFPTDILVGAAIGTLAGVVVPALHKVGNGDLSVVPAPGSRGVHISFRVSL